jgi:hypothetical protein
MIKNTNLENTNLEDTHLLLEKCIMLLSFLLATDAIQNVEACTKAIELVKSYEERTNV